MNVWNTVLWEDFYIVYFIFYSELDAYLNEGPFLSYYMTKYSTCELQMHDSAVGQTFYGLAVQKGSRLKTPLSNAILHLREDGKLDKLKEKWLYSMCNSKDHSMQPDQFSVIYFAGPFIMVVVVGAISVLIFLVEVLLKRYSNISIVGHLRSIMTRGLLCCRSKDMSNT